MPINPSVGEVFNTMQKTYCCLPPDILYGCDVGVSVDSIFSNSNIIGVIPRNLTKKIKGQNISNMFRNVNIMPNLEYYYDANGIFNSVFDDITEFVEVENGIGDDYTVVFRDEYGKLKKR